MNPLLSVRDAITTGFIVALPVALAVAAGDAGGPGGAGNFAGAFTLGLGSDPANGYQLLIGIGAWLGTVMLFNVWAFIWPNRRRILGLVPASDEQQARARPVALLASRTNFVLSIPMLLCMAAATHGLPLQAPGR